MFSLADVASTVAGKVRLEQLKMLSIFLAVMSVVGLGAISLVIFEFWATARHSVLLTGGALIGGCYAALLFICALHKFGTNVSIAASEPLRLGLVRICCVLGTAWGVFLVVLMHGATSDERSLLYGLVIGLLSASMVITPPSASFAFWLPVATGGLIAVTSISHALDFAGTLLLSAYILLSIFCVFYLNRAMIRRILAEIDQSEGRATIGMLLRDFEDTAADWLWMTNENGFLIHASSRFAQAAHATQDQLYGRDFATLIEERRRPRAPVQRKPTAPELALHMTRRTPFSNVEVALDFGGEPTWWALTGKPIFSAQNVFEGYRGVCSDVTQAKLSDERADYLAHFDDLTGLANRRLFNEQLAKRLAEKVVGLVALLCLDLDGFKAINDNHGHPTGDELLVVVARRLQSQLRGCDVSARLGGDEFAVLVEHDGVEMLEGLAHRLVNDLSRPYHVDGLELRIGVSIGLAIASRDDRSDVSLMRNADAALYEAKAAGRGTFRFFSQELKEKGQRLRVLKAELADAIRDDDLHLDYQPIFDLRSGRLECVEALVRWDRKSGETLSPAEFVPLAESSRSIDDLGEWVLERACQEAGRLPAGTKLAVNVSPLQLHGRRLIERVHAVLQLNRLNPHQLQLELTETAFFEMSDSTLAILHELRSHGVGINLDDFGVGQTSLGQLRRFPFSSLKIDQSFVQDLPNNPSARAIVKGLTTMAGDMDILVTAEGIETLEQLELVRAFRCDCAQGYLLARPMSMTGIIEGAYAAKNPLRALQAHC